MKLAKSHLNMTRGIPTFLLTGVVLFAASCVQLKAPKDPIEINLNVKIDQEVRVRLDKDVEDLISENPDLF